MRRVLDIAAKDLRVWSRDPAALGILLGMPALLIVILGAALGGIMSGGGARIPVAIVNLDSKPYVATQDQAAKLESALTDSSRIRSLFVMERTRDLQSVKSRVANGDLTAALVIPKGFSATLGQGPVRLEVLRDPGSDVSAGIWESIVRGVATRYSTAVVVVRTAIEAAQRVGSPALSQPGGANAVVGYAISQGSRDDALDSVKVTDTLSAGTVKLGAIDYYALSMTAMFLMFGAMFGATSSVRERVERTMDRMLASATSRQSIVGGKMLGVFGLGMAQFVVLYAFTRFVLHVVWGSSVAAIGLVATAEVAAVTGLATLISSIATTQRAVSGIGPLLIQIQAALGGAFFQIDILPKWIQPIRFLSVVGYAMEGWRAVQVNGAGVTGVLLPSAALFGLAAVFFAFGLWRMGVSR